MGALPQPSRPRGICVRLRGDDRAGLVRLRTTALAWWMVVATVFCRSIQAECILVVPVVADSV